MAAKKTTQAESTPAASSEVGKLFEVATNTIRGLLADAGKHVLGVEAAINGCVSAIVTLRAGTTRKVLSKKTSKTVEVFDWDGRSPEYREWKKDVLDPMIEELIPVEFRGTIKTKLQNRVQAEVKKTATVAQLDHLGIQKVSKTQKQTQKRNDQQQRASESAFDVDSLTAYIGASEIGENKHTLADAAMETAAICEALKFRVTSEFEDQSPADRKATAKLIRQGMDHLMAAGAIYVAAESTVKV